MPKRIQRKRAKGWRMPPNTVIITRPGKWGNPFKVGDSHPKTGKAITAKEAVELFKQSLFTYTHKYGALGDFYYDEATLYGIRQELKGKNLACWCKIGDPCHGDYLLEIANA